MNVILEEIGLTQNERKVYLALNGLGQSTVGPIVDRAQITNSKIYVILEKLVAKGLVSHSQINGVRHFKTADASRLLDFLEEKRKRIEGEERLVREIMPKLLAQQKGTEKRTEVEVFEGFSGLRSAREHQLLLMKKGAELLVLGASKFSTSQYEHYWENFHMRRIEKGIRCRYLMYDDSRASEGKKREKWKLTAVRYIKNPPQHPIRVDIAGGRVSIAIDAVTPFVISVKNQDVSDSFRAYFEALWVQAKP